MGCKFDFTISFNYDEDDVSDLEELSFEDIADELGRVTIEDCCLEDGVVTYYGIAYKTIELECILGLFEDYGHGDIVVTWVEEDSPDVIDNPVLSNYVDFSEYGSPLYVFAPCCGKYTSPYFERPATVEIYGKNAIEE